ncbi:MAG: DUF2147 domain-containing protein [Opitutales bacterium]|jgi:uncharacterized protein (DUF2147 family)
MSKPSALFCLLMLFCSQLMAQSDKIVGLWITDNDKSQVRISQTEDGSYCGQIVWLSENKDRTDAENPDPQLRSRKVLGLQILSNFHYNEAKNKWFDGTIYDPKSGKTYDCFMWFDDNNDLHVKGYVMGMRFIGRQTVWRRETELRD